MATATIAGKDVEVDKEGFMQNPDDWNQEIAAGTSGDSEDGESHANRGKTRESHFHGECPDRCDSQQSRNPKIYFIRSPGSKTPGSYPVPYKVLNPTA